MAARKGPYPTEPRRAATGMPASACTRCSKAMQKLYPFPLASGTLRPALCAHCQDEWDDFLKEAVRRWHDGLRGCFFCRRQLGDALFPARGPFGTSCANCALSISVLTAG